MTDYQRIEKSIRYIQANFKQQPSLDEIASQAHLSPFHFQRLFKNWAGVSPKKFLQYINVEYAKGLLAQRVSLADVSFQTGLSGTSRLHDLFVSLEGMTPGEYKNGGESLQIQYSMAETLFGDVIIASTTKGVCHLAFVTDESEAIQSLRVLFPLATLQQKTNSVQQKVLKIFTKDWTDLTTIKLHLKASPFQLKVWQSLLFIPFGQIATYSSIASSIDQPLASRAVGTAIGSNPIAYLIPCHRVIRSTGVMGDYHWGSARKTAILGWEAAQVHVEDHLAIDNHA